MTRLTVLTVVWTLSLAACQITGGSGPNTAGPPDAPDTPDTPDSPDTAAPAHHSNGAAVTSPPAGRTLALWGNQKITGTALQPALLEAAGGQVLAEWVLDRTIAQALQERRLAVTPAQVNQEKSNLLAALSADADQAQQLLEQMRQLRGLGAERFAGLLTRNAGLRLLVQDQIQVTEAALHQAFDRQYGPRYEVRLITLDTLQQCSEVLRRVRAGESFTDQAIEHSTDASKAQGGLLSPISPEDPTYPQGLRQAMVKLAVGQVSDPVALDKGFALVRLERKIDGQSVKFDDVKAELAQSVRRETEQMFMARLARQMLAQTDLTVFDPWLQKSWERQRQAAAPQ